MNGEIKRWKKEWKRFGGEGKGEKGQTRREGREENTKVVCGKDERPV